RGVRAVLGAAVQGTPCTGLQPASRTGTSKEEELDVQPYRGDSTDSQQRGRRVPEVDRRTSRVRAPIDRAFEQARGDDRRGAGREDVEEAQAASEGSDG